MNLGQLFGAGQWWLLLEELLIVNGQNRQIHVEPDCFDLGFDLRFSWSRLHADLRRVEDNVRTGENLVPFDDDTAAASFHRIARRPRSDRIRVAHGGEHVHDAGFSSVYGRRDSLGNAEADEAQARFHDDFSVWSSVDRLRLLRNRRMAKPTGARQSAIFSIGARHGIKSDPPAQRVGRVAVYFKSSRKIRATIDRRHTGRRRLLGYNVA